MLSRAPVVIIAALLVAAAPSAVARHPPPNAPKAPPAPGGPPSCAGANALRNPGFETGWTSWDYLAHPPGAESLVVKITPSSSLFFALVFSSSPFSHRVATSRLGTMVLYSVFAFARHQPLRQA